MVSGAGWSQFFSPHFEQPHEACFARLGWSHWLPFPTFQLAPALEGQGSHRAALRAWGGGRRDSFISGHLKEHQTSLPVKQPPQQTQWPPHKPHKTRSCRAMPNTKTSLMFHREKTSPRGYAHPKQRPLQTQNLKSSIPDLLCELGQPWKPS